MRLFVAVLPPLTVLDELDRLIQDLRRRGTQGDNPGSTEDNPGGPANKPVSTSDTTGGSSDTAGGAGDSATDPAADQPLRWARRDQWHITLAFLGDVPPQQVPELETRLARAATRHRQLEVQLSRGGRFGSSILWAGVAGDREPLRALARSAQAAARRTGVSVDDGRFRPHLTLARSRQRVDLRPWVESLDRWASTSWRVEDIALVRSRLGATPTYTVVGRYALRH